jgi:nucleotide-binding universal stress UspA family protein
MSTLRRTVVETPKNRATTRRHETFRHPAHKLFVALDDSAASARALKYLTDFVCPTGKFQIHLVHVLPPLPAMLLEHGGAANPEEEPRLEADLFRQQRDWISAAKKSAEKGLKEAKITLQNAGVPRRSVRALFCEPGENQDAADSILKMAREYGCHTIIVGRESVSWFHELFSQELAEELLRRGKGFSIWVIE